MLVYSPELKQQTQAAPDASSLQEVMWTLLCLADEDPLCKAAIRVSGALPRLVPLLGFSPFSGPINTYMGIPALAARALRVLGGAGSCAQEEQQLNPPGSRAQPSDAPRGGAEYDEACWQQAAVPYLARLVSSGEGLQEGTTSRHSLHALPRLASLSSSQKMSECLLASALAQLSTTSVQSGCVSCSSCKKHA